MTPKKANKIGLPKPKKGAPGRGAGRPGAGIGRAKKKPIVRKKASMRFIAR